MKVFIALICLLVFGCLAVSCIWVVSECVIYLAMDTPFNWMSVYAFLVLAGVQLFFAILAVSFNLEQKKKMMSDGHAEIESNKSKTNKN